MYPFQLFRATMCVGLVIVLPASIAAQTTDNKALEQLRKVEQNSQAAKKEKTDEAASARARKGIDTKPPYAAPVQGQVSKTTAQQAADRANQTTRDGGAGRKAFTGTDRITVPSPGQAAATPKPPSAVPTTKPVVKVQPAATPAKVVTQPPRTTPPVQPRAVTPVAQPRPSAPVTTLPKSVVAAARPAAPPAPAPARAAPAAPAAKPSTTTTPPTR